MENIRVFLGSNVTVNSDQPTWEIMLGLLGEPPEKWEVCAEPSVFRGNGMAGCLSVAKKSNGKIQRIQRQRSISKGGKDPESQGGLGNYLFNLLSI